MFHIRHSVASSHHLRSSKYRLPPGPWGLPFIGVAPRLDPTGPHKTLTDWSYKYGDVFRMKMYGEDFVVLNSYDSIYKALVTQGNDFAGRPLIFRFKVVYKFCDGIIFSSNTKKWLFLKKVAMQTLKMYGNNLLKLEEISLEVIDEMLEELTTAAKQGKAVDIASIMQTTTATIITSILYGKNVDSESVQGILHHFVSLQSVIARTPLGFALDTLPTLRHFPLQKTYRRVVEVQQMLGKVIQKESQDARDRYEPGNPKCFNHGLFEYQANNGGSDEQEFDITEDDLYALNTDMIQAGTVTTSFTLTSLMAVLVNHPEIQNKMAAEIRHVVSDGQLHLADREKMDYCEAVILEVLRYHTMLPLNATHSTTIDTSMEGYDIPKGTSVFTNLWKVNHDPDFWDAPWEFSPERFLDQDGNLVALDHPKRKRLLAFGAGRRVCIGQTLARNRLFLMVTSLIQHFHFLPESESNRPKHDPRDYVNGFNIFPYPYKVIIKGRN